MRGSRRRLLVASGGLVASLAGCLGGVPAGSAPSDTADFETTSESTATTEVSDYPATVNATTTVERDEIEYIAANDTVRYVAAYRHSNPDEVENGSEPEREPVYEHVPFEEWVETECASVGAERVNEAMSERLGDAEGVSAGVTNDDGELKIFVAHETTLNRDGDVISEPNVSYDRVRQVAPERAEVTLTLSGRSRSCVVSVATREQEIQQE
ncbi:hypothetical protein [Halorussus amylolyticus]|uniref:hypothetical protein n=1 Tax=Halorussus amylolyticus TaxID=1126242 RepID=UPI0010507C90|nr:hypothetical protein [Halorussus amylolyticus]